MTAQNYPILGIDVSKRKLDACLLGATGDTASVQVPNTAAGFKKLKVWLVRHRTEQVTVALESTNVYSAGVSLFFYEQGATVYLANPAQVHAYMHSELRRAKTDKADAQAIARFAAALADRLRPWQPLPAHYQELRHLVRHLCELVRSRARVKNRIEKGSYLSSAAAASIRRSLRVELAFYDRTLRTLLTEIRKYLQPYPDLTGRFELLTSVPGVGQMTALTFMAEIPDVRQFASAKQLAAYAGVTPRIRHSGQHTPLSQPISKVGNARLRRAFYMAALTAKQH